MKLKELNTIRLMASQMGYNTNNLTVDQAIALYNGIKPLLDKVLPTTTPMSEDEFDDIFDNGFSGIDLSEV